MSNNEILKQVIECAIDNGFIVPHNAFNFEVYVDLDQDFISIIWDFYQDFGKERIDCEPDCCGINKDKEYHVNDIIFSHDFAKAFWGEEYRTWNKGYLSTWEYHLQQMVIKKDPIRYLEKFLSPI